MDGKENESLSLCFVLYYTENVNQGLKVGPTTLIPSYLKSYYLHSWKLS